MCLNIDFDSYDETKNYGDIMKLKNFDYKFKLLKLNEKVFENDLNVLTPNCNCFVCLTQYKRAYIHHLIKCKELNASILMNIHNIYQTKKLYEIYSGFKAQNQRNNYLMWFITTYCEVNN